MVPPAVGWDCFQLNEPNSLHRVSTKGLLLCYPSGAEATVEETSKTSRTRARSRKGGARSANLSPQRIRSVVICQKCCGAVANALNGGPACRPGILQLTCLENLVAIARQRGVITRNMALPCLALLTQRAGRGGCGLLRSNWA